MTLDDADLERVGRHVAVIVCRKLAEALAKVASELEGEPNDYHAPIINASGPFKKRTLPRRNVRPTAEDYTFAARWKQRRK